MKTSTLTTANGVDAGKMRTPRVWTAVALNSAAVAVAHASALVIVRLIGAK